MVRSMVSFCECLLSLGCIPGSSSYYFFVQQIYPVCYWNHSTEYSSSILIVQVRCLMNWLPIKSESHLPHRQTLLFTICLFQFPKCCEPLKFRLHYGNHDLSCDVSVIIDPSLDLLGLTPFLGFLVSFGKALVSFSFLWIFLYRRCSRSTRRSLQQQYHG